MNGVPGLDVLALEIGAWTLLRCADLRDWHRTDPGAATRAGTAGACAPTLPAAARPPVILSPLSSLSRVMKIGMSSASVSQVDLTTLARWTVRPRLMAVPGVANVAIWGQRDRQLQVLVHPDRLRANGVSLQDVISSRA